MDMKPQTHPCSVKYLLSQMQFPALGLPPTKPVPDQATQLNQQQPNQVRVPQEETFADQWIESQNLHRVS